MVDDTCNSSSQDAKAVLKIVASLDYGMRFCLFLSFSLPSFFFFFFNV